MSAIKPLEIKTSKKTNKRTIGMGAILKMIFLLFCLLGSYFIYDFYTQVQLNKISFKKSPVSANSILPQTEKLKKEAEKVAEEKKKEVVGQVMGQAEAIAKPLIAKTNEAVSDYFYSHTIEELIKRLILALPERRQKAIEDWLKQK